IAEIETYVKNNEVKISNIKPDNQSQFIWHSPEQKTEYAVVYLHGYSASHGEAQPIITNFSKQFGCNTYLPRLALHGLTDVDAFENLTPKLLVDSAKEAIQVAKTIGEKIIIISTSTGCTLGTYLAANDPAIKGLIMTAPNFDLHDSNSHLLLKPWGKQIFRKMMGGDYRSWDTNSEAKNYWTTKNRIEGAIALRSLLDQTMTDETFSKINIPVFIGYYYKNSTSFDRIISIDAIKEFGKKIQTPEDKKEIIPISTGRGHVITSKYMNPEWEAVQRKIFKFAQEKLNLKPVLLIQPKSHEVVR
ncbi:alpha/beta hydrolase, partial [Saprospiraceae bacterium]|nr:alpha/beta hydrolase [Saprospiraceae bacterium]